MGRPPPAREQSALGRPPVSQPGPPVGGLRPQGRSSTSSGTASIANAGRPNAVGADGKRPVLAWAGVSPKPPAGGGNSAAAACGTPSSSHIGSSPSPTTAAQTPPHPTSPSPPRTDGDGFTLVQRRPLRPTPSTTTTPHEAHAGLAQAPPSGSDGRETDGDLPPKEVPVFDMGTQDDDEGMGGCDGDDMGNSEGRSVDQLREDWQFQQKLLAWVKTQGLDADHPTLLQAEQQVQRAHRAWQDAKPRHAVSRRMQWAEAALRKARKRADRAEQSLDELDQWYQSEWSSRDDHLRWCRERVRAREAHLADITREAAEDYTVDGFASAEAEGGSSGRALDLAAKSLGDEIGPALERIRECLPEGSDLHQQVTGALSTVTTLHGKVTLATQRRAHWRRGDSTGHDVGTHDQTHEDGDGNWGDDYHDDDAPWDDDEGGMDTSDAAAPRWIMDDEAPPGAYGERRWKQRKVGDGAVNGQAGAQRIRTGGTADDLNARREAIVQQAKFDGVEVDAGEIAQMDAGQLDAWASEHLL